MSKRNKQKRVHRQKVRQDREMAMATLVGMFIALDMVADKTEDTDILRVLYQWSILFPHIERNMRDVMVGQLIANLAEEPPSALMPCIRRIAEERSIALRLHPDAHGEEALAMLFAKHGVTQADGSKSVTLCPELPPPLENN